MIENLILFLELSGGILTLLFVYAFYKAGWNKDIFMKNWRKAEGKSTIRKAVIVILSAPIIFAIVLYSLNAEAEWFEGATVFTGIDMTSSQSPLCQRFGVNDQLTSNIGFTQNIFSEKDINLGLKYTHHSCAINPDKNGYDAAGIFVEWRIW